MKVAGKEITIAEYPYLFGDREEGKNYNLLENIPWTWREIAVAQVFDKINEVLGDKKDLFFIWQLKEKFGSMRIYWVITDNEEAEDNFKLISLDQYQKISQIVYEGEIATEKICHFCGKPATKLTKGWILHICDSCEKDIKD